MDYKKTLPKRAQASHKGTFGKILNISGSSKYQGAAYLSSISALKIGAGYVTLAAPRKVCNNIVAKSPDITFLPLEDELLQNIKLISGKIPAIDVISMGCGIGQSTRTSFFVGKVLEILIAKNLPTVLDADALNIIAKSKIDNLPQKTVITPHEAEIARLLHTSTKEVAENREFFAKEAAKKFNAITVLKGHRTIIAKPDGEFFINESGNSALAKAGTGDVLTGIIAGLLAQGCSPYDAAVLGTYIHGKSGECASAKLTEYSVLASDVLEFIPDAVKTIL